MTMRTRRVPAAVLLAGAALAATAAPALAAPAPKAGAADQPVAHVISQVGGPLVDCVVKSGLKHCAPMKLNP